MKINKDIFKYSINPVSKEYFFLTPTERALIERSLMDWHLQDHVQKLTAPATTKEDVVNSVLLIESMNDVELIENMAQMQHMTYGGHWQSDNPQDGSMILAVRPEIYSLFKVGRVNNAQDFFNEQGWDYDGQYAKTLLPYETDKV